MMITRSSSSIRVVTHPSSRTWSSWREEEKELMKNRDDSSRFARAEPTGSAISHLLFVKSSQRTRSSLSPCSRR